MKYKNLCYKIKKNKLRILKIKQINKSFKNKQKFMLHKNPCKNVIAALFPVPDPTNNPNVPQLGNG